METKTKTKTRRRPQRLSKDESKKVEKGNFKDTEQKN